MSEQVLKAIVVDDEPLARDELMFLLNECGGVDVVGQGANAAAALELCGTKTPHIAFVDLRMPGPDGIALADAIRARHPEVRVVMVSAHDDAAIRAFDAQVLDYLLKPVRLERLRDTLERVRAAMPDENTSAEPLDRIAVRRKGAYVVIDMNSVVYFEVRDELVWAVTQDDRYAIDLTLAALTKRVSEDVFFRSHRGVIVRIARIRSIEPTGGSTYELVLDHPDSPRVPLARERVRQLRAKIPFAG